MRVIISSVEFSRSQKPRGSRSPPPQKWGPDFASFPDSDVTKGERKGQLPPPPPGQQTRGRKQPHQKYFMTNDHKNEYDKVCWNELK